MVNKTVIIPVIDIESIDSAMPSIVEWLTRLRSNVKVNLIHTIDLHGLDAATPILEEMRIKNIQLRKLAEKFEVHDMKASHKVKIGSVMDMVVDEAKKSNAFSVLLCTDGRSGFTKLLAGNVVNGIINKSPCPVVVFKPKLVRFTDKIAQDVSSRFKKLTSQTTAEQSV